MRRSVRALTALLILGGCIPQPRGRPPSRRGQPGPPRIGAPRITPLATPEQHRMCLADLGRMGVRYEALPDRSFPNGCSALQAVKLVAIGTPITNLGAMRCPLARAFASWVSDVVQPAARAAFGQGVRRIESYGTFACRPVNNVAGGRLSEHGLANAVDIAAFQLDDGRRVTVLGGWGQGDDATRTFLRAAHDGACRRFGVVLGPDANALHRDHLHFDMGAGHYCR